MTEIEKCEKFWTLPSITITDTYSLKSLPELNETLTTVGDRKKIDDSTLQFTQNGVAVLVNIKWSAHIHYQPGEGRRIWASIYAHRSCQKAERLTIEVFMLSS